MTRLAQLKETPMKVSMPCGITSDRLELKSIVAIWMPMNNPAKTPITMAATCPPGRKLVTFITTVNAMNAASKKMPKALKRIAPQNARRTAFIGGGSTAYAATEAIFLTISLYASISGENSHLTAATMRSVLHLINFQIASASGFRTRFLKSVQSPVVRPFTTLMNACTSHFPTLRKNAPTARSAFHARFAQPAIVLKNSCHHAGGGGGAL